MIAMFPTVVEYQRSTYGDQAFPVSAARVWNSLPQHVVNAPSLPVFWSRLKTFFGLCYSYNIHEDGVCQFSPIRLGDDPNIKIDDENDASAIC